MQKEKRTLTRIAVGLVLFMLAFPVVLREARAAPDPTFSILNPGPGSWAGAWTAETPNPSDVGSANFTFNYGTTSVGDTFFINVTISNADRVKSWGLGIVYDTTKLGYNDSKRPPDNAFAPMEGAAVPVPKVTDDVDATHKIFKWGFAYIMPSPAWSFNGTGVLCQIRFNIVGSVNASYPKWTTLLTFDPDWTNVYQYPSGTPTCAFESGKVQYLYPLAPKTPTLAINPARVVDATLTPCHSFTVNLTVKDAQDLYRWQAEVYYNSSILNATDATEGSFLPSYGTTVFLATITRDFNETHGQIMLSETLSGVELGAYGDGQLAALTFHVLDNGSTPIVISNEALYDSTDTPITHTTADGYFSNVLRAEISIQPPEIKDPTLVPGTTFDINVTINNVENMKKCGFNLTYDPTVLMEISILAPKVFGQYPTKYLQVDDVNGYIFVNLTYPNPIATMTPLPILMVTFEVEAVGVSPLNLNQTIMEDPSGNPIPHDVNNGVFFGLVVDVSVDNVQTDVNAAYTGWTVHVNVTVSNLGNLTATFNVNAFYDANLIGTLPVTALDPGNQTTITFNWNTTTAPPCHNYTISAEIPPLPYETNLANNQLSDGNVKIKLMGDVDGNGLVDMGDINAVLAAFGSTPGHDRWNPAVDLYPDNKIDMTDIVLVLENFGKHC